jgi:hypothetical protein
MTFGTMRRFITIALLMLGAPIASAQPDFKVQVWGSSQIEFTKLVSAYAELRAKAQANAPELKVTDDPAEIQRAELVLASGIRSARAGARRGDIFTREISAAFRRVLAAEMNPRTWAAIMDDNPQSFEHEINGVYPKGRTLSTMPPNILAKLPALPPGLEYRFLGRSLVLHDTAANIIIDRLPRAISCRGCPS